MYLYYFKRIQFFYCVNLMMYFYLFLILALIYFIYFRFTIETFITENINGELTPDSKYLIDTTQLSQKKQLLFLDKINNLMKKSKQNIDKGKCIDAQGTLPTQNPSVRQLIKIKTLKQIIYLKNLFPIINFHFLTNYSLKILTRLYVVKMKLREKNNVIKKSNW